MNAVGVVAVYLDREEDLLLFEALREELCEPVGSLLLVFFCLLGELPRQLHLPLLDPPQLLLQQLLFVSVAQCLHLRLLYLLQNIFSLGELNRPIHLSILELEQLLPMLLLPLSRRHRLLQGILQSISP